MNWFSLNSGPGDAAFNMALDEALLAAAPQLGAPVLRFYGWTESAATFGYFQKFAEVARATALRPLIRRPTGGGLVPHDADWTYSLVAPAGHEWHALTATDSYRRVHEWIQAAFARLGVETEVAPCCRKFRISNSEFQISNQKSQIENPELEIPGQCFIGHEKFDLLWHGKKIAGAAQRRSKAGLLIQGSVQPPPLALARSDWEQAMVAVAQSNGRADWKEFHPPTALMLQAKQRAHEKYSQPAHNERR